MDPVQGPAKVEAAPGGKPPKPPKDPSEPKTKKTKTEQQEAQAALWLDSAAWVISGCEVNNSANKMLTDAWVVLNELKQAPPERVFLGMFDLTRRVLIEECELQGRTHLRS